MQGQEFYRYQDPQGRIVIVDSLNQVPPAQRDKSERLVYSAVPREPKAPSEVPSSIPASTAEIRPSREEKQISAPGVDWPSFTLGFGVAVLVGLSLLMIGRLANPLARFLVFAVTLGLLAGAYFGWLGRSTGQGETLLATPPAVIEDARRAVEQMKQRNQAQDEEIQRVFRESR